MESEMVFDSDPDKSCKGITTASPINATNSTNLSKLNKPLENHRRNNHQ